MNLELDLKLFHMMGGMLLSMIDEIPDDQMGQCDGDANPPSWILGHLVIANEFGCLTLGQDAPLAEGYMPVFGPGSPARGDHPAKATLVRHYEESRDRFVKAVQSATPEQLAAPRESPILREKLPLAIDMIGHLLTTHQAMHIGQLSSWRRTRGMASILQI